MKKMRAKNTDAANFSDPELAELLITKLTPIKKATYILSDGSIVDIGIFDSPIGGYRLGAYLCRDTDDKIIDGMVCKFKNPNGHEWLQALQQGFSEKYLN